MVFLSGKDSRKLPCCQRVKRGKVHIRPVDRFQLVVQRLGLAQHLTARSQITRSLAPRRPYGAAPLLDRGLAASRPIARMKPDLPVPGPPLTMCR